LPLHFALSEDDPANCDNDEGYCGPCDDFGKGFKDQSNAFATEAHTTAIGLSASWFLNDFRPAATASVICRWPRFIMPLTWRRDCQTLAFTASIASKHLLATHFRVSSPDLGAKNTLTAAPMPIPATK
jgi:hypothetical protein